MPIPENPDTVVVKNEFYPTGLKEIQVWNHYQRYKNNVISEINSMPVILWIFVDVNTPIVKRKIFNTPFTIAKKNYDKVITGRTVSISSELKSNTDVIIIDVDPGPNANEQQLKDAVKRLLDSSIGKSSMVTGNRIISTAKGYHVYFYLGRKMSLNSIRKILFKMMLIEFKDIYLINQKNPKGSNINLDLTPTTPHGGHQIPYALCRNGLMSLDVTNSLDTFNRRSVIIK